MISHEDDNKSKPGLAKARKKGSKETEKKRERGTRPSQFKKLEKKT